VAESKGGIHESGRGEGDRGEKGSPVSPLSPIRGLCLFNMCVLFGG